MEDDHKQTFTETAHSTSLEIDLLVFCDSSAAYYTSRPMTSYNDGATQGWFTTALGSTQIAIRIKLWLTCDDLVTSTKTSSSSTTTRILTTTVENTPTTSIKMTVSYLNNTECFLDAG
jgi:hypothetical protein